MEPQFLVGLGRTLQEGKREMTATPPHKGLCLPVFSLLLMETPVLFSLSVAPTTAIMSLSDSFQHPFPWPISMNWFEAVGLPNH